MCFGAVTLFKVCDAYYVNTPIDMITNLWKLCLPSSSEWLIGTLLCLVSRACTVFSFLFQSLATAITLSRAPAEEKKYHSIQWSADLSFKESLL